MLVRPRVEGGRACPALLEGRLNACSSHRWLVDNRSRIAGTIQDAAASATRIVADQPDVVILHHGYNESLLRPHSQRIWSFEHLYGPPRPIAAVVGSSIARRWSSIGSRLSLAQHWVPPCRFEAVLNWVVEYLQAESGAKIILVGVTPWSPLLQRYAPGSQSAPATYDAILRAVAETNHVEYVPFECFTVAARVSTAAEIVPGGTHFSVRGHEAVAQVLAGSVLNAVDDGWSDPSRRPDRQ
jgi:hypothetical protein